MVREGERGRGDGRRGGRGRRGRSKGGREVVAERGWELTN